MESASNSNWSINFELESLESAHSKRFKVQITIINYYSKVQNHSKFRNLSLFTQIKTHHCRLTGYWATEFQLVCMKQLCFHLQKIVYCYSLKIEKYVILNFLHESIAILPNHFHHVLSILRDVHIRTVNIHYREFVFSQCFHWLSLHTSICKSSVSSVRTNMLRSSLSISRT